MKEQTIVLCTLVLVLVFSLISIGVASDKNAVALRAEDIVINGLLDGCWESANWYDINPETAYMERGQWGNYHGRFAVLYDDEYIYFAYQAFDEVLVTEKSGEEIWQDDCVEVWFDWMGAGQERLAGYYQIGLSPSSLDGTPAKWIWRTVDDVARDKGLKGIEFAATITEDGWIVEAKFRLTAFDGAFPVPPEPVPFNVSPVNRDVSGWSADANWNHITWSGDFTGAHNQPSAWGTLRFE